LLEADDEETDRQKVGRRQMKEKLERGPSPSLLTALRSWLSQAGGFS